MGNNNQWKRISSPSREADLLWMGKNLPIILPRWVRNFLWLLNGNSLWYNNPILFCLTDHLQLVRAQSSYTFSSYPHSLPSWFHLVAWLWLPHTCSWLPTCISSFDFSLNSSFHCWTASTVYPMGTSNLWSPKPKPLLPSPSSSPCSVNHQGKLRSLLRACRDLGDRWRLVASPGGVPQCKTD